MKPYLGNKDTNGTHGVMGAVLTFAGGLLVGILAMLPLVKPPYQEPPVSPTYAAQVNRAIDQVQHAAWDVAWANPSDAMLAWYTDINVRLQGIECELFPQECN